MTVSIAGQIYDCTRAVRIGDRATLHLSDGGTVEFVGVSDAGWVRFQLVDGDWEWQEPAVSLDDRVTQLENTIERGADVVSNPYDALASAIYVARQTLHGARIATDDQRLRASGLYEDWVPGSYHAGDIRNVVGQTWECHADHDNAEHPDITPDNPQTWANFWRPLHGTSPETARPWVQPRYGTTDIYHAGEYMIWTDGTTQRCRQDTNYSPEEYAPAWEVVDDG